MLTTFKRTEKDPEEPVSVYNFLSHVNNLLSSHKSRVQGEVTSLSLNYPTAVYFTIKDKEVDALLDCVIWKSNYRANGIDLKVGDEIIVTGTPEVFIPKGRFSLKLQTIEYAGEGALKKAYDDLKKKLAAEGLFKTELKRPLPQFPKKIGIITSMSGVVIKDFTSNIGRYGFQIITVDSRVEGKDAIHELLGAFKAMAKQDIEVLVVMRGGGSWESLQPFNTESVVRAVAKFKCPVLTGIGHDTDVTLVQMVADVGVSTPTAVAEALNESWDSALAAVELSERKIVGALHRNISEISRSLNNNSNKVRTMFSELEKKISGANMAFQKCMSGLRSAVRSKQALILESSKRVSLLFKRDIENLRASISSKFQQIATVQKTKLTNLKERLETTEKLINAVNPERNLKLGYSLSYADGKLIRSKADITIGSTVETKVSEGSFISVVKEI